MWKRVYGKYKEYVCMYISLYVNLVIIFEYKFVGKIY